MVAERGVTGVRVPELGETADMEVMARGEVAWKCSPSSDSPPSPSPSLPPPPPPSSSSSSSDSTGERPSLTCRIRYNTSSRKILSIFFLMCN